MENKDIKKRIALIKKKNYLSKADTDIFNERAYKEIDKKRKNTCDTHEDGA